MQVSDVAKVKNIETALSLSPWTEEQYRLETGREDSFCGVAIIPSGERLIGYLISRRVGDICELYNIGVEADFQGQGVAKALLKILESHLIKLHVPKIQLEVRAGNVRARAFYQRLGFEEQGTRKGLYSNPIEDGILMQKTLK